MSRKGLIWDPRWLDLAVASKHAILLGKLARPGHAKANAYLSELFDDALRKSKDIHELNGLLQTMIRVQHAEATNSLVAMLTKHAKPKGKYQWGLYWIARLIPDLPKSAVPILEELLPTLHEKAIDELVEHVAALKNKP